MRIQVCKNLGASPFWGPKSGYKGGNFGYMKKYSSHKPLARLHWYLVWSILGTRRFKFAQM